jgi:hypothetical protein
MTAVSADQKQTKVMLSNSSASFAFLPSPPPLPPSSSSSVYSHHHNRQYDDDGRSVVMIRG